MKNNIQKLIYKSLDETIEVLPNDITYEKDTETEIYGSNGLLDSLGLVTFLVNLEQKISDDFDCDITIADDKAYSEKTSPFKNIGTLTNYIIPKLK